MMRTTVLLSMLLLTTACGVVEQKKDAALRTMGKATLNSVFRLASAEGTAPSESTGRFTGAVICDASPAPAPAQEAAPAPVSLTKASEPARLAAPVPSVLPGTPAERSFEIAYSRFEDLPEIPAMRVLVRSGESEHLQGEVTRVVKKMRIDDRLIRNEAMKHAVANAKVAAAAHAERPQYIADFEVHFAEELEKVTMIPNAPPSPPAPAKECSSQVRTAS